MGRIEDRKAHEGSRLRRKARRLAWAGKMIFADQCGLLALVRDCR